MLFKVVFFDLGDTLIQPATKSWIPGAVDLVSNLIQNKIRIGIISNTANLDRKQLAGLLPGDFNWKQFDEHLITLSSEVKIEMPSPAFLNWPLKNPD
jgi:ribonucleotide monophosphatase NagD (HAD superfamily)